MLKLKPTIFLLLLTAIIISPLGTTKVTIIKASVNVENYTDNSEETADNDGIPQEYELNTLGTSPVKTDTDDNNVPDSEEDFDNDGLNNLMEYNSQTNPYYDDSDYDGLRDADEIQKYNTNPIKEDSDADGLTDSNELKYNMNPLLGDTNSNGVMDGDETYDVTIIPDESEKDNIVEFSLNAKLEGKHIHSVSVSNVGESNPYLHPGIAGYVGEPFQIFSPISLKDTVISFKFSKELLKDSEFKPAIYCFNDNTNKLEILPDQATDLSEGEVSALMSDFSTYILLNQNAVNMRSKYSTAPPTKKSKLYSIFSIFSKKKDSKTSDSDGDLLTDYCEKMGMATSTGDLVYTDPYNADSDGDGLSDGNEMISESSYFLLKSDPNTADSDGDGIVDNTDPEPLVYNITDRTLLLACDLFDTDLEPNIGKLVGNLGKSELSNFRIVDANDNDFISFEEFLDKGFASVAIKISRQGKKDAIIYAIRGTDVDKDPILDCMTDICLGLGFDTTQSKKAFSLYKKLTEKYPNAEFFMAGHSLGGRLVQDTLYKTYKANGGMAGADSIMTPVHSATFNALGYNKAQYFTNSLFNGDNVEKISKMLNNYYIKKDLVGEGFGNSALFKRLGTDIGPWIAKDENGQVVNVNKLLPYEPTKLHVKEWFINDNDLCYPNCVCY